MYRRPVRVRWLVAVTAVLVACTSTTVTPTAQPNPPPTTSTPSSSPTGTTLANGSTLPSDCSSRKASATQTVGFVAEGRAWAVDPQGERLSCLFPVGDPGPFTFGPQGDRVLLRGLQVESLAPDAPEWPATGVSPTVFDWGHPIGLAIVYASPSGAPEKRFMDDGSVERLKALPAGRYEAIAYHPSGLALGFIVKNGDRQGIWLSTNEGEDPERLVYARPETTFSSIAFSADGTKLWWIAQHAGAISEIHWMDLADRSGFQTVLTRGLAPTATDLKLAPAGALMAATQGTGCEDQQAMVIDRNGASPAVAGATEPTRALGWLDATTLLVASGGCSERATLSTVRWTEREGGSSSSAAVVVEGVDAGAPRTVLHDAPTEVPAPPNEATPAPPGGVG